MKHCDKHFMRALLSFSFLDFLIPLVSSSRIPDVPKSLHRKHLPFAAARPHDEEAAVPKC